MNVNMEYQEMNTYPNTVIITGASSGIGLDAARGFLEAGSNVVLNARNVERLTEAAASLGRSDSIALVPGDIGNPETGVVVSSISVLYSLFTLRPASRPAPP